MELEFSGDIWYWKGPAPWYFVTIPQPFGGDIKEISSAVTYGWGVIPVVARIGETEWTTSIIPKAESYLVPIKAKIRKAEQLNEGQTVTIRLKVG